MDNKLLVNRFIDIGFEIKKSDYTDSSKKVKCTEYKYYPDYLLEKHYTLLVVTHEATEIRFNGDPSPLGTREKIDYRLYTHNLDGSFHDSIFQMSYESDWDIEYIDKCFNDLFKSELIKKKREDILKELI